MVVPEAVAIQQGLIPSKGFARWVNTHTQRGKSNIAAIPFLLGYVWWEWKYISGWRKEVVDRRNKYNTRMVKIREEFQEWKKAEKVMPKKVLVENEKKLSPEFNTIYV